MSFVSKAAYVCSHPNRPSHSHPPQIVPRIFGPVLTVTIFASGAAYLWHQGTDISLTNSVVPLLSVVVSVPTVKRFDVYPLLTCHTGRLDFGLQVSRVIQPLLQVLTQGFVALARNG